MAALYLWGMEIGIAHSTRSFAVSACFALITGACGDDSASSGSDSSVATADDDGDRVRADLDR